MKNKPDDYQANNYIVCFVDLLGQRHVLAGQGILPISNNSAELETFRNVVRNSVGAILRLQNYADTFISAMSKQGRPSEMRQSLPEELHKDWDAMQQVNVKTQHWSDGLMHYANLGDKTIRCPMNSVYSLLGAAANHCLISLASGHPVRCAVDVAWAIELCEGELYGAAVARAYELESAVAQYPRVVVGEMTVDYLKAQVGRPIENLFDQYEADLARRCLDFLVQDLDGHWIVHYLGDGFKGIFNKESLTDLYNEALNYIRAQVALHSENKDTKLSIRYALLQSYFESHPI